MRVVCDCSNDAVYIVNGNIGMCTNCLINSLTKYEPVHVKEIDRNVLNDTILKKYKQLGVVL